MWPGLAPESRLSLLSRARQGGVLSLRARRSAKPGPSESDPTGEIGHEYLRSQITVQKDNSKNTELDDRLSVW